MNPVFFKAGQDLAKRSLLQLKNASAAVEAGGDADELISLWAGYVAIIFGYCCGALDGYDSGKKVFEIVIKSGEGQLPP